jgi:flagellar biosynthesis GTPase FlhF
LAEKSAKEAQKKLLSKIAADKKEQDKAEEKKKTSDQRALEKAAKSAAKNAAKEQAKEIAAQKRQEKAFPHEENLQQAIITEEMAAEINKHRKFARSMINEDESDGSVISSVCLRNDESDSETELNNPFGLQPMCDNCGCRPCCFKAASSFFLKLFEDMKDHFSNEGVAEDDLNEILRYHLLRNYQCSQSGISSFSLQLPIEPCVILGVRQMCPNSENIYSLEIEKLPKGLKET